MTEDGELLSGVLPLIVEWYRADRRSLPWREEPTPYHVWISEIMLQQTRIEAVIPYYRRFLAAFPTVADLAAAEEDRLLKLWEGLGYYSRARNLKKTAGLLMERHGGELPRSVRELKALPGIGDYTAGAIASIAYGEPEPAVDGNVLRVMTRVLAWDADIMEQRTRAAMAAILREKYPSGEAAGLLTEGIMELGETLCIPNGEAKCADCPLRGQCRACLSGAVERYPVKAAPRARRVEERTVLLLRCGGRCAIRRREEKGLLAGLWEFPNLEGSLTQTQIRTLLTEQGAAPGAIVPCGGAKHVFTHVEWHMNGYVVDCGREAEGYLWKTAEEIGEEYSIPTAFRFYRKQLRNLLNT